MKSVPLPVNVTNTSTAIHVRCCEAVTPLRPDAVLQEVPTEFSMEQLRGEKKKNCYVKVLSRDAHQLFSLDDFRKTVIKRAAM